MRDEELTLAILRHAESIRTQKSLAEQLGYSVGKINYILKALMAKGLIKAENFATSSNKKQYRYLLTKEGIKIKVALAEKFIEKKKQEYNELLLELEITKKETLCKH